MQELELVNGQVRTVNHCRSCGAKIYDARECEDCEYGAE